jgi:hypothetical protein
MNADEKECRADAERISEALAEMEEITRVIFLGGMQAFADGRLTFEQARDRVLNLVARHRAGEEIRVSELEFGEVAARRAR